MEEEGSSDSECPLSTARSSRPSSQSSLDSTIRTPPSRPTTFASATKAFWTSRFPLPPPSGSSSSSTRVPRSTPRTRGSASPWPLTTASTRRPSSPCPSTASTIMSSCLPRRSTASGRRSSSQSLPTANSARSSLESPPPLTPLTGSSSLESPPCTPLTGTSSLESPPPLTACTGRPSSYGTTAPSAESESEYVRSSEDSGRASSSSSSCAELYPAVYGPVMVWVKDKPFEFGTIPVYHSAKISLPVLVTMVAYCRERGWSEILPLGGWYEVCRTKLKLSYHIGWIYIRLFNILFQQMDRVEGDLNDNGKWDERCNFLKSKKYDKNGEFVVPMMEFVLFLYLQHSYRMMSKHGPPPPSVTYPEGFTPLQEPHFADSSDDEFDESGMEKEEKKIIDENLQLRFMSNHLGVMISLLETGLAASGRLDMEIVDVLDLLLYAAKADDITAGSMTLKEVIMGGGFGGYNAMSHTVDRRIFIRWVKSSLRVNPYGPSSGFLKSTIPGLITGVLDDFRFVHVRRENRIMRNLSDAPVCWYTIANVGKQVLFLKDIPIQADIRLYKCTNSFIYLIGSFSCVAVEWCKDCTIFLGCISGVLRVTGCREIDLVGIARQIIINETIMSEFHVHTPCSPLLAGQSITQLYFGPYSSYYPNLEVDMHLAKIGPVLSQWDKVRGMSFDGVPVNCEFQWTRIEGKELEEFKFPFRFPGPTQHNPILLQARHAWALEKKRRTFRKWTGTRSDMLLLDELDLDPEQSQLMLSILLQRFTKFVIENGYHHEIAGLVSYNEASFPDRRPAPRWFEDEPQSFSDVARNLIFVTEGRIKKQFRERDEEDIDGEGGRTEESR